MLRHPLDLVEDPAEDLLRHVAAHGGHGARRARRVERLDGLAQDVQLRDASPAVLLRRPRDREREARRHERLELRELHGSAVRAREALERGERVALDELLERARRVGVERADGGGGGVARSALWLRPRAVEELVVEQRADLADERVDARAAGLCCATNAATSARAASSGASAVDASSSFVSGLVRLPSANQCSIARRE